MVTAHLSLPTPSSSLINLILLMIFLILLMIKFDNNHPHSHLVFQQQSKASCTYGGLNKQIIRERKLAKFQRFSRRGVQNISRRRVTNCRKATFYVEKVACCTSEKNEQLEKKKMSNFPGVGFRALIFWMTHLCRKISLFDICAFLHLNESG